MGGGQELVHRCLPVLWNFCEDARSCPPKASRTFEGDPPQESPGGPACVQVLGEGAQWGGMGLWRGKWRLMRSLEEVPEPSGNSWELGGPIPSFWCLKRLICKWKKGPAFLASRP